MKRTFAFILVALWFAGSAAAQTLTLSNGARLVLQNDGLLDLGINTTLVEAGGLVTGGTGRIAATRSLDKPTDVNVGGLGAMITSSANLGETVVVRGHAIQTFIRNQSIARYFDITPEKETGLDATLNFFYDESELNGLPEALLQLARSEDEGMTWTQFNSSADPGGNLVKLSGIDSFSRWTLASSDTPLPVELTLFEATLDGQDVLMRWATASETNNAGFEMQGLGNGGWGGLAFVDGHGTTTEAQTYAHRIAGLEPGAHRFRLKQIDYDGTFAYSPEVEVAVDLDAAHLLTTPYPNPFNEEARLSLAVKRSQRVQVAVFDLLGRKVAVLYDGEVTANTARALVLEANGLPGGLYLIRAFGDYFTATKHVVRVP